MATYGHATLERNMKTYELAVYIGRFQPWHIGHQSVLQQCHSIARKTLIIIGCEYAGIRTIRNPWTYAERFRMIPEGSLTAAVYDCKTDAGWKLSVEDKTVPFMLEPKEIVLVGYTKDSSSYYLRMFPEWARHEVQPIVDIDATIIRDAYFTRGIILEKYLEPQAIDFLKKFYNTPTYKDIRESYSRH